jgi:outer membrane protein OmpA-like peptidoglycan-associated protein
VKNLASLSILRSASLALLLLGASRDAAAQAQISTQYSAERFELTGHRDGILGVEWADVRGHLAFDAGLWVGYANDPITVYEMQSGDRVGALVHNRFGGDLVVALRLKDRLELGVAAALIFGQSEDGAAGMLVGDTYGNGIGDLRITPKVTLLRRGSTAVALLASLSLPTSTVDDFGGDRSATFSPAVAVSHVLGRVRLAGNIGYRTRPETETLNLSVNDEIYLRAGVGYRFPSSLELDGTFDIATGADDFFGAFNRNFSEVRGGASYDLTRGVRVFGALGAGLAEGYGTPDWRALVGFRLGPSGERPAEPKRDRDNDGILDVADRCPDQAETRNSFEDADGCPDDPDPDKDNVIGAADQCPTEPEDADGFEDGNGCPDPDNDNDKILDVEDKCRDVAGVPETQGCPDPDRDGDTIVDRLDKCPDQPGVAALQGCPDPDRDGDTVVDRIDNCPDEPGLPENQGCKKKELVKLVDGKIEILDIVYFNLNAAVIQPKSYALLDNVARVLVSHPEITKVRVEGHTDNQGDDVYNKKLSQRRADAVRAYLIKKGVAGARLDAVGFGEEQPKVDNGTVEGRATNRRVEFVIVGGSDTVKTTP